RELGARQPAQDVWHIDTPRPDDLQHQELEQSLAERCQLGLDQHVRDTSTLCNKGTRITQGPQVRRRAVTSISMRMRGSASPAESMVAAGRTSPKYRRSTGQHGSKSAASGSR